MFKSQRGYENRSLVLSFVDNCVVEIIIYARISD